MVIPHFLHFSVDMVLWQMGCYWYGSLEVNTPMLNNLLNLCMQYSYFITIYNINFFTVFIHNSMHKSFCISSYCSFVFVLKEIKTEAVPVIFICNLYSKQTVLNKIMQRQINCCFFLCNVDLVRWYNQGKRAGKRWKQIRMVRLSLHSPNKFKQ